MAGEIAFYQQIVESMNEGVMVLDNQGIIILFNDSAAHILGLDPETVINKAFGQVFMMDMEGNDEFCQSLVDAVHNSAVGLINTVEFKRKDKDIRVITMATSYLNNLKKTDIPNAGIVIVINDITEITQSREEEKKLNHQLTEAFVRMEETNKELEAAAKKVKWGRFFILLALILGLAGTTGYLWFQGNLSSVLFSREGPPQLEAGMGMDRVAVMVQPLYSSISLAGSVSPLEEINVTAPFDGKIKEKFFVYDQKVKKGDRLIAMDTSKLEVELRNAKATHIKARQEYRVLMSWKKSPEVSNAKRSLTKAKNNLENSKRKLEESQVLFKKGIIAKSEFDSSRGEYINQQMDFKTSQEALTSILEKGSRDNQDIAKMVLANARVNIEEIEEKLTCTVVYAPVSGIVIKPVQNNGVGQDGGKSVESGLSVSQGDVLFTIGNLDGLSVNARVDEIDIGKIRFDQKVRVVGDAFADTPLTGYVRNISSNAKSDGMEGPMFEVTVAIKKLTPEHREKIRLGMSTNLEIMIYDNPEALVIPLNAVELRGNKAFVRIMDSSGTPVEKEVTTGITTLDSVEILQGLEPGDVVHYSGADMSGPIMPGDLPDDMMLDPDTQPAGSESPDFDGF
jgi:HlyD family secretion protein